MATFALLHASIVAVNSDSLSVVNGKPAENSTNILRPGTPRRFLARLRTERSILRAPKSASALLMEENGDEIPAEPVDGDSPAEATSTGAWAFGSTEEFFTPPTAARNKSAFAVKFCIIRKVPPKSTTAMSLSGPELESINFLAAARAWIWSGAAIVELSKKKIRYLFSPFA